MIYKLRMTLYEVNTTFCDDKSKFQCLSENAYRNNTYHSSFFLKRESCAYF